MMLLGCVATALCACSFINGTSGPGECAGPLARSLSMRQTDALEVTNLGCTIDEIPFRPDGSPNVTVCGLCNPQGTQANGHNPNCPLSYVCNDDGRCIEATKYSLFGAECPGGGPNLWCGALVCINRVCAQCQNGTTFGNAVCIGGQYYVGYLAQLTANVDAILAISSLAISLGLIFISAVTLCCSFHRATRQLNRILVLRTLKTSSK